MSLKNKVAVITGGASGIGSAAAALMAKQGAKVVIVDWNESCCHQKAQEIRDKGGQALSWPADVSTLFKRNRLFRKLLTTLAVWIFCLIMPLLTPI